MGWISGIVVFLLTWWVVLFMVLPWGLRRDEMGKPENPRILQKLILTTAVSAVFWLILYGLIEADIISFRDIAAAMMKEDTTS
jgi:predicted secreted protein